MVAVIGLIESDVLLFDDVGCVVELFGTLLEELFCEFFAGIFEVVVFNVLEGVFGTGVPLL